MLNELTEWARGIVVVVGLAALVEMLLPNGNFRRFGHLLMGLFVMLAIAKPLLGVLQVPVTLDSWQLEAVRGTTGYVWQGSHAVGVRQAADGKVLSGYLAEQLQRLVAWTLGLDPRDVVVDVWESTGDGWATRPQYVRIRLLRVPHFETQHDGEPGTQPEQIALAVAAQIAAVYRIDQANVEVIMPR